MNPTKVFTVPDAETVALETSLYLTELVEGAKLPTDDLVPVKSSLESISDVRRREKAEEITVKNTELLEYAKRIQMRKTAIAEGSSNNVLTDTKQMLYDASVFRTILNKQEFAVPLREFKEIQDKELQQFYDTWKNVLIAE